MCLATIALWLMVLGASAGAASGRWEELGANEALITAALRTELGYDERELSFWDRLVLSQSSLLWANLIPPDTAEIPPTPSLLLTTTMSPRSHLPPPQPRGILWNGPWCPPPARAM